MKGHSMALQFSTAYYLQTDSMAKVMNRTMEQLLRIHATTNGWVAMLPLVAMLINAMPQRQMGRTPYKVVYGRKIRMPMDVVTTLMTVPAT